MNAPRIAAIPSCANREIAVVEDDWIVRVAVVMVFILSPPPEGWCSILPPAGLLARGIQTGSAFPEHSLQWRVGPARPHTVAGAAAASGFQTLDRIPSCSPKGTSDGQIIEKFYRAANGISTSLTMAATTA